MNETTNQRKFLRNVRQSVLVTLVLLLLCGLVFPVVLSGISAVIFPSQANGSMITVNGEAVGAEYVGQEFTEDYFMKGRPSAYHYNTYYEDEEGNQYYNDGSEFAGLSSGSNNYAPSNPALAARVESDIIGYVAFRLHVDEGNLPGAEDLFELQLAGVAEIAGMDAEALRAQAAEVPENTYEVVAYLSEIAGLDGEQAARAEEAVPTLYDLQKAAVAEAAGVSAEDVEKEIAAIPADLVTASGSGLDPHISPASAAYQIPMLAEKSGLSVEQLEQIVADNTTGKMLGVFGEETVTVLGVNIDIAEAMGLS